MRGVLEASRDFHSVGGAGTSMGRGFLKKGVINSQLYMGNGSYHGLTKLDG